MPAGACSLGVGRVRCATRRFVAQPGASLLAVQCKIVSLGPRNLRDVPHHAAAAQMKLGPPAPDSVLFVISDPWAYSTFWGMGIDFTCFCWACHGLLVVWK